MRLPSEALQQSGEVWIAAAAIGRILLQVPPWRRVLFDRQQLTLSVKQTRMNSPCIFCEIIAGRSPVSLICEDELSLAFMTLRPFAAGECTVIPRQHIDHFTDVDDAVAAHMMVVAQRIGRRMRAHFKPQRVGMVVHGYGVAHAHLVIVPQNGPHDITSTHYARIEDGQITFGNTHLPFTERSTLDAHAKLLSSD